MANKIISVVLSLCLTVLLAASLTGCEVDNDDDNQLPGWPYGSFEQTIDGAVLSSDGEVIRELEFTVSARMNADGETMDFSVDTPDDYRYFTDGMENGWSDRDFGAPAFSYFTSMGYGFDRFASEHTIIHFAFEAENGCFLITWDLGETFLVGSADPDATPADIFDYFRAYRDYLYTSFVRGFESQEFDWAIDCMEVSAGGEFIRNLECTISGTFDPDLQEDDVLFLNLQTPFYYRYDAWNMVDGYSYRHYNDFDFRYFVCMGFGGDKADNSPKRMFCAFDIVEQCFLFTWNECETFLVGSTDPDVTHTDILDHFSEYLDYLDAWFSGELPYDPT